MTNPKPKDMKLYNLAKKQIYSKYKKHSAYRSSALVKKYKELYKKKYKDNVAYSGKKPDKKGLTRWHKEKWRNQRGGVGYRKKGDVYRPTKRITKKTPRTFSELSKSSIRKAQREKKLTGRVKKFK